MWLIIIIVGYVLIDAWVRAYRAQRELANLVRILNKNCTHLANCIDEANGRIEELEARYPAPYVSAEVELEPDMMLAPDHERWLGK